MRCAASSPTSCTVHSHSPGDCADASARGACSDRGSVTAEFAAVVPAVVLLLALCLGGLQLTSHQLRVQDAAAVAARVTARGEPGSASGYVAQLVPGASLSVDARGELVCAVVRAAPAAGPFRGITLIGSSCAPRIPT